MVATRSLLYNILKIRIGYYQFLTSAIPLRLLEVRRAYWGIETGSHCRRDFTLREDATRSSIGNGARVLANINNLTLALFRQAGFQNAAQARPYPLHIFLKLFLFLSPPFPDFVTTMTGDCGSFDIKALLC